MNMEPQRLAAEGAVNSTAIIPSVEERQKTAERIHYLDNLRAVAMMLGVLLHAALAYAEPARSIWFATDRVGSVVIDAGIWFVHLFRMSLFFLLSGYFAKLTVTKKGVKSFLRGRLLRIALPFVVFYPFLVAALTIVIVFALNYLKEPEGIIGLIARASQSAEAPKGQASYTTMHMWFLYYLMMFALLASWLPNLRTLETGWLLEYPIFWLLLPWLLVPAVLIAGVPLPAPESFIPTVWPFMFYGTFFWLGWQLFGKENLIARLHPWRWYLALGCCVVFIPYYMLLPTLQLALFENEIPKYPLWQQLSSAALTGYLSLGLTITVIVLGQRYLASRKAWLGLFADASYWVYLVHLPLVLGLQTLLIPLAVSIWLKLMIVIVATLIVSMATYLVFVRYTPIGWMLHGKRNFP
jgi:glucans biosynthesis protein C